MRLRFFFCGVLRQVCLFLKRGATQSKEDEDGQDPLSVAVQQANADIVTLCVGVQQLGEGAGGAALTACLSALSVRLRLARMNEEMKEAEGALGQAGQYAASSPTEQQFRKCIQEFICLAIAEC